MGKLADVNPRSTYRTRAHMLDPIQRACGVIWLMALHGQWGLQRDLIVMSHS